MAEDKNTDNELEKEPENISEDTIEQSVNSKEVDVVAQETKKAAPDTAEIETSEASFDEENIKNNAQEMITVRPVKFQDFELVEPNRSIKKNLDIMQDVSMHISVELGRTKSTIKEVMDYKEGSIVELNKIAGEQVEVYANNKLVAKGEVIVIEDKFGVRVTSTNLPKTIQ